jgi:hypothetical protein
VKAPGTAAVFVLLLLFAPPGWVRVAAQGPADLTGSWVLNRVSSQFPEEIGFSAEAFVGVPGARGGTGGGRRGGGGGGGGRSTEGIRGPVPLIPETQDDSQRRRFLTDEVRLPPERLTIAVTPASVTLTPEPGAARTVHPGRRDDGVTIGPITSTTTAMWEGDRLMVAYNAEAGRTVRYVYAVNPSPSPRQLIVEIEFVGRGGGDKVRRVYDPAPPSPPAGTQSNSTSNEPSTARTAIDQRPDAQLRGLVTLGLVVEGVDAEAAKCGLKGDALETAVAKHLTDAGFRVARNTDDETFLYVNVNSATASAGFCVTRYDVTLYSHTAAPLAHTSAPVELQVELLHKGGLAGGTPAQNGDTVTKNVLEHVDQFATRVKNASK